MLGQVLGWGLLGCPCTVEQLPLQKRQVGLETEKRRMRFLRRIFGEEGHWGPDAVSSP